MIKYLPGLLIIITVALDYLYSYGSWGNDETLFVHWSGVKGFQMYWHIHQVSMMFNWIILGVVMVLPALRNPVNQIIAVSYLLWKISLTVIYFNVGYSTTEGERVMKMSLFFIFVFIGLLLNRKKWANLN